MAYSRRARGPTINIWPGFVDALTQLTMVIVFVLLIFTVGQFYLSGTVSDQDAAIRKLTQQVNQLNDMLSVERRGNEELKATIATLETETAQAKSDKATAETAATGAQQQLSDRD